MRNWLRRFRANYTEGFRVSSRYSYACVQCGQYKRAMWEFIRWPYWTGRFE